MVRSADLATARHGAQVTRQYTIHGDTPHTAIPRLGFLPVMGVLASKAPEPLMLLNQLQQPVLPDSTDLSTAWLRQYKYCWWWLARPAAQRRCLATSPMCAAPNNIPAIPPHMPPVLHVARSLLLTHLAGHCSTLSSLQTSLKRVFPRHPQQQPPRTRETSAGSHSTAQRSTAQRSTARPGPAPLKCCLSSAVMLSPPPASQHEASSCSNKVPQVI